MAAQINPTEIGYYYVDWINLAGDRFEWRVVMNTAMSLRFL
jgi:hypothetical protein